MVTRPVQGPCLLLAFAYYTASFSAAHNEEPGFFAGFTFSLLVVAGNQIMYSWHPLWGHLNTRHVALTALCAVNATWQSSLYINKNW